MAYLKTVTNVYLGGGDIGVKGLLSAAMRRKEQRTLIDKSWHFHHFLSAGIPRINRI